MERPEFASEQLQVVGYCDPQSAVAGQSVRFMISCLEPTFEAQVVQLIHGDVNPAGPGFKEREISAAINGTHRGEAQELKRGSYVIVPESPKLTNISSFTVQVTLMQTARVGEPQAIVNKWSATEGGFCLQLDPQGAVSCLLQGNDEEKCEISTNVPVRLGEWYHATLAYDAETRYAEVVQSSLRVWPLDPTSARCGGTMTAVPCLANGAPLLFAAVSRDASAELTSFFNGKLTGPRILGHAELSASPRASSQQEEPLAAWHFGYLVGTDRVVSLGDAALEGRVVNMPARAVTGPTWNGQTVSLDGVPDEYDAIHFHDDDLVDAQWRPSLEWKIPANLPSAVYAVRLRAGDSEDYIPFYVRPGVRAQRAKIAFLVPTFSHLAYANEHYMMWSHRVGTGDVEIAEALALGTAYERSHYSYAADQRLLSLYDHHSDGAGVCYASLRRPLVNMRPKYNWPFLKFRSPQKFNADLYLVDWLEAKSLKFDVLTDHDVDRDPELLRDYRLVLSGSHPEYTTLNMLEGFERYLVSGGRFMYLGGNGYYWVTSVDPCRPYVIEVRRSGPGTRTWGAAPGEHLHSTTGEAGGLWRYRGWAPQRWLGVGTTAVGCDQGYPYRRIDGTDDDEVQFVFNGVSSSVFGDFGLMLGGAAGYEIDRSAVELGTPPLARVLARSFGHSDTYQHVVEEVLESDGAQGGTTNPLVHADMVLIAYPNGGAVFSVGSVCWCGSLSHNDYKNDISKITENVVMRFLEPG